MFCALLDLLTYAGNANYLFWSFVRAEISTAGSASLMEKHQEGKEEQSSALPSVVGPTVHRTRASDSVPSLPCVSFNKKQQHQRRKKTKKKHVNELFIRDFWKNVLAVTTVKLGSVGVSSLHFF